MKSLKMFQIFKRWRISVQELRSEVGALRAENDRLRLKLADLQLAREQADRHAEDRRREKEALRSRLSDQKKAVELNELNSAQLIAKITELRAENDNLRRRADLSPPI